jgi:ubiquinone/menaquinone biosynthesis C-methylase UbiE
MNTKPNLQNPRTKIMDVKEAYNIWADRYDTNENKTRDLETISLRTILANVDFDDCLEVGCGTGKNTEWLITKAKHITAIDLSDKMLEKARLRINSSNVQFIQADIINEWLFTEKQFDLVTFSLVLEHIENLNDIFEKVSKVTKAGSWVYIGELHPFKQYNGTKARFDTQDGVKTVACFDHHISDFTIAATNNGFQIIEIQEYFDDNDKKTIPRIMTMLLRKKQD